MTYFPFCASSAPGRPLAAWREDSRVLETHRSQEADRLLRLIGRYRTLLADATDGLLRRGIEREIDSLEERLRRLDAKRRQNIPCLIARPGPARSDS
jgi:hypothetical protein